MDAYLAYFFAGYRGECFDDDFSLAVRYVCGRRGLIVLSLLPSSCSDNTKSTVQQSRMIGFITVNMLLACEYNLYSLMAAS